MTTPAQTPPLHGFSSTPTAPAATSNPVSQEAPPVFEPDRLADIHLPEAVSQWPDAPGWWLLLGLLVLILILIVAWKIRSGSASHQQARRIKHLRAQARQELSAIKEDYQQHQSAQAVARQLSVFLRRYALSVYPRHQVASLTDQQWLHLLDHLSNSNHFSGQFAELLLHAPYQPQEQAIDSKGLSRLLEASNKLLETPVNLAASPNISQGQR